MSIVFIASAAKEAKPCASPHSLAPSRADATHSSQEIRLTSGFHPHHELVAHSIHACRLGAIDRALQLFICVPKRRTTRHMQCGGEALGLHQRSLVLQSTTACRENVVPRRILGASFDRPHPARPMLGRQEQAPPPAADRGIVDRHTVVHRRDQEAEGSQPVADAAAWWTAGEPRTGFQLHHRAWPASHPKQAVQVPRSMSRR